MPVYTIAEAKDQLSKLVNETLDGEEVIITRHGKVVVELRPAKHSERGRPSAQLLDEIAARAKRRRSLGGSGAAIVRRMRDRYP